MIPSSCFTTYSMLYCILSMFDGKKHTDNDMTKIISYFFSAVFYLDPSAGEENVYFYWPPQSTDVTAVRGKHQINDWLVLKENMKKIKVYKFLQTQSHG